MVTSGGNIIERKAFSERLKKALADAGYKEIAYTALTREFNFRSGVPAITIHAVRKWMVGDAIPTQDRLVTLADWLHVSAEWLRFGKGSVHAGSRGLKQMPTDDMFLMSDIARLQDHDKRIVREFVRVLIRKGAGQ